MEEPRKGGTAGGHGDGAAPELRQKIEERKMRMRTIVCCLLALTMLGLSPAAEAQDLRVTASTAPYSGSTAGHGSSFTVYYRLTNYGTGFTTNFRTYFYYCTTSTYNASTCTYLTYDTNNEDFTTNQSRSYYHTMSVPSAAMYGTGYIIIRADGQNKVKETNEGNNDRYDAITVTTRPDLYFSSSTVPYTGNTNAVGSSFTGRYRIYNKSGTSKLTGNFYIRYYYCPGQTTSGCVSLAAQYISSDINAGSYLNLTSLALAIPTSAQNGTAYIRAYLDSTGAVTESNETNNNDYDPITVQDIPADLYVYSSSAPYSGSSAAAGSAFTVQYTLRNASSKYNIIRDFRTYFYWCTSTSFSSCTYMTYDAISTDFNKGQSHSFYHTLTVPTYATRGTARFDP